MSKAENLVANEYDRRPIDFKDEEFPSNIIHRVRSSDEGQTAIADVIRGKNAIAQVSFSEDGARIQELNVAFLRDPESEEYTNRGPEQIIFKISAVDPKLESDALDRAYTLIKRLLLNDDLSIKETKQELENFVKKNPKVLLLRYNPEEQTEISNGRLELIEDAYKYSLKSERLSNLIDSRMKVPSTYLPYTDEGREFLQQQLSGDLLVCFGDGNSFGIANKAGFEKELDELLEIAASAIETEIGVPCMVMRRGGDELVIVLQYRGRRSFDNAQKAINKLNSLFEKCLPLRDERVRAMEEYSNYKHAMHIVRENFMKYLGKHEELSFESQDSFIRIFKHYINQHYLGKRYSEKELSKLKIGEIQREAVDKAFRNPDGTFKYPARSPGTFDFGCAKLHKGFSSEDWILALAQAERELERSKKHTKTQSMKANWVPDNMVLRDAEKAELEEVRRTHAKLKELDAFIANPGLDRDERVKAIFERSRLGSLTPGLQHLHKIGNIQKTRIGDVFPFSENVEFLMVQGDLEKFGIINKVLGMSRADEIIDLNTSKSLEILKNAFLLRYGGGGDILIIPMKKALTPEKSGQKDTQFSEPQAPEFLKAMLRRRAFDYHFAKYSSNPRLNAIIEIEDSERETLASIAKELGIGNGTSKKKKDGVKELRLKGAGISFNYWTVNASPSDYLKDLIPK
ncbi:MAG: hypothetical protein GYA55_07570 [SAR324 cluster bacterium]|uniref:Uncharacterized protein n=1 Tax=SAR324 cluster bacterium TaxID=2024889 RepID=A0A7X9IKB7_9DELT|nr:hypothetical protein [SAR324 cluster bacterium]